MNKACLFLLISLITMSCASNKPTLLVSPLQSNWAPTVNPSTCVPQKGFHPYLAASAGFGQPELLDTSYRNFNLAVHGGLLLQTSLENDWKTGVFTSLNTSAACSTVDLDPNQDARYMMTNEERSMLLSKYNSITSEFCLRGGFLVNLQFGAAALYTHFISQYEVGEYFNLRKKIDNIGNYYNLSTERSTLGYGFGGDISIKQDKNINAGIILELNNMYTSTQTFDSTYLEQDEGLFGTHIVIKDEDGKQLLLVKKKIELYLEQNKIRISFCFTDIDSTMSLIYRW